MLIAEIFHSIQGEGELTGVPSVFVRTSGCNLRCNWCDTPYASWEPEGAQMTIEEILRRVGSYPAAHCVLTGGEPMIAPGIRELAAGLRQHGKHITIETAATIPPDGIACDLASLSPKLANSAPDARLPQAWQRKHEELRLQPKVIRQWLEDYNCQLKFVYTAPADLQEIQNVLAKVNYPLPPWKILLMPEGTSTEAIRARSLELAEICKQHGYRYCDRLHVALFGHRRGT